jgi:polar amino acid transport system permease protein
MATEALPGSPREVWRDPDPDFEGFASLEGLATAPRTGRPHPGRWVSAGLVVLALAMVAHTLVANPHFQWHIVRHYFLSRSILQGLGLTLWLTAAVMVVGYALGLALAAMRLSDNPVLRTVSATYVWLLRAVPPLVQLLFWYELASLYPRLTIGVPFGPGLASFRTAHLITGIVAAFISLTLDVGAFSAEIIRGGLLAVDPGQREAADALGLPPWRTFRRVILPQAMPAIIPATGNMLIAMLKATSIVSVIAVSDLLYSTELIYNQNFQVIPLLLVATVWYVVLTSVLMVVQRQVERHYARGSGHKPLSFLAAARRSLPLFGAVSADLPPLT